MACTLSRLVVHGRQALRQFPRATDRSMPHQFLEVALLTDVGNVRQYNEDSIAADAERGIVALADGMGGHRAGEVASRMATETLVAGLSAAVDSFRANGR